MPKRSASEKRVQIIRPIHGKLTRDGKLTEPDIHWIIEKWLDRHPQIRCRSDAIRAVRGRWTTSDGLRTEVIVTSIVYGDDVADYDPEDDVQLVRVLPGGRSLP